MTLHEAACRFSEAVTAFNRSPITILLVIPFCTAFLIVGNVVVGIDKAVWCLTLILSIDASLEARAVLLQQGKASGDVE